LKFLPHRQLQYRLPLLQRYRNRQLLWQLSRLLLLCPGLK
jgi:hypothetical protein